MEEEIDTSLQARLQHLSSSVLASTNNNENIITSNSTPSQVSNNVDHTMEEDNDDDENDDEVIESTTKNRGGKKSKGQLKKEKQKRKAANAVNNTNIPSSSSTTITNSSSTTTPSTSSSNITTPEITIEYTLPTLDHVQDPELLALMKHFLPDSIINASSSSTESSDKQEKPTGTEDDEDENMDDSLDQLDHDDAEEHKNMFDQMGGAKLSKKQYKKLFSLFVSSLKREVTHPEIVEAHDVTSLDPKLLITLKSLRNTVPVPRHWSHKRKYLQGKRGYEKPPFQLPEFIAATGITKMRNDDIQAQDSKNLKSKTRERVRPKMGRIEIDYGILRDAFFIHQTKPKLTHFGEIYYEGKENEINYDYLKPGKLSDKLKIALGLPTEPDKIVPPPWLINMQRYGPPPSYPYLRIPGLNAPIPPGHSYGYNPGEWGKPPVDEYGNPLYGDVFGIYSTYNGENIEQNETMGTGSVKHYWGEIIDDTTNNEISLTQKQIQSIENNSLEQPIVPTIISSTTAEEELDEENKSIMDGTASVPYTISSGMETPAETLQLRKGTTSVQPQDTQPKALYTVLEEKRTSLSGSLLGTRTTYVIPTTGTTTLSSTTAIVPGTEEVYNPATLSSSSSTGITVNLSPEELAKLDETEIAKKYAEAQAAQQAALRQNKEDLNDLFDEQEKKKKRKVDSGEDKITAKKKKEFKF